MFLIMLLEFSMKKNHKKFINLIYISISIILSLFIIKISNNFEFWTNFLNYLELVVYGLHLVTLDHIKLYL